MSEENISKENIPKENIPNSDINMVIVIDKNKLPEELRDKFPQDLQNMLMKLLQDKDNNKQDKDNNKQDKDNNKQDKDNNKQDKDNGIFAIKTGRVVGNIYDKNFRLDDIDEK